MHTPRQRRALRSSFLHVLLALVCACSFEAPTLLSPDAGTDGAPATDAPPGGDPPSALEMSSTSVDVFESSTATVSVRLRSKPAHDVTVSLTSSAPTVASVPASMSFTPANYATSQELVINGVPDDNAANETVTITLAAPSIPSTSLTTLTASVTDDDTQAVEVSTSAMTVGEGSNAQLGVSLSFQPPGPFTVSLLSNNSAVATVSPASVTFTPSNYNMPQQVTISGVQDANAAPDSTTITAFAPGATAAAAMININDDDTMALVLSATSLSINEGSTVTLSVSLAAQPPEELNIPIGSNDSGVALLYTNMLTFTSSNWNTPQTVFVYGVGDPDFMSESTTIAVGTSALFRNVSVAVTDVPNCGDNRCDEDHVSCPNDCQDPCQPPFCVPP